jgi:hypothetical protein
VIWADLAQFTITLFDASRIRMYGSSCPETDAVTVPWYPAGVTAPDRISDVWCCSVLSTNWNGSGSMSCSVFVFHVSDLVPSVTVTAWSVQPVNTALSRTWSFWSGYRDPVFTHSPVSLSWISPVASPDTDTVSGPWNPVTVILFE